MGRASGGGGSGLARRCRSITKSFGIGTLDGACSDVLSTGYNGGANSHETPLHRTTNSGGDRVRAFRISRLSFNSCLFSRVCPSKTGRHPFRACCCSPFVSTSFSLGSTSTLYSVVTPPLATTVLSDPCVNTTMRARVPQAFGMAGRRHENKATKQERSETHDANKIDELARQKAMLCEVDVRLVSSRQKTRRATRRNLVAVIKNVCACEHCRFRARLLTRIVDGKRESRMFPLIAFSCHTLSQRHL